MKKEELTAEAINIEKPCSESWDEMSGGEKTRACSHCNENVNDISMMTEDEAFDLIEKSNGNLCVRYEAHPVTNAPIFTDKLYQITRNTGITAGVLTTTIAVSSSAYGQEPHKTNNFIKTNTKVTQVKTTITKQNIKPPKVSPTPPIKPRPRPPKIMGKIAIRRWIKNPLMQAVNRGQTTKVRFMIARGADVNEIDKNYYSRTALHVAVERSNLKIAKILLNAGADLEAQDQYKNTPLMSLRWTTSVEMIQLLTQYGADINAKNRSGQTALMNASRTSNLKLVKALLEAGADATIKDNFKNSALNYAYTEELKQILIAYGAEPKS